MRDKFHSLSRGFRLLIQLVLIVIALSLLLTTPTPERLAALLAALLQLINGE